MCIRVQEECNLMTCRSKSRARQSHVHTINIVFSSFAIVSMYPVSSGFKEWIHLFVQDSFGQKRETLPGAIVIRVEPTSSM